jgi:hypothetical protein
LYGFDVDINDRFGGDVTSSSASFHYSPSDHRFDQVMTYYHSDEFEAWLVGDLGMSSTRLNGEVDVETRSDQCYACMDSPGQDAFFSDGSASFLKNPTRERSIIAHEYMHAVSYTYNSLDQDFEADALNEGYSDFFAVADRHANTSVTTTRLGAYVGLSSGRTVDNSYQVDDFFSNDPDTRDLTDDGNYSEHDGGVVLAGALWDFQKSINDVTLAAEITLASLGYLDGDPSFFDARSAMLAAADGTGNSQHKCDIRHAFADHGIGSGMSVVYSGPFTLDEGEQGTWTASPTCPDGSPSYTWSVNQGAGWYKIGTGISVTWGKSQISSTLTVDLRVEASAGGETVTSERDVTINNNDGGGGGGGGGGGDDPPGGCNAVTPTYICEGAEANTAGAAPVGARPDTLQIGPVAPNPVRSQARLSVALPESGTVEIVLYNTIGQQVRRQSVARSAGWHAVPIEVRRLPSGMYVARITVGEKTETRRLVVVR